MKTILPLALMVALLAACSDQTNPLEPSDAAVSAATPGVQAAQATTRSLQEFIAAQGSYCFDDGGGGCLLFVPPIDNFIGWFSPQYAAAVDYAGLANAWIEAASGGAVSFGTEIRGTVKERTLPDGRALVSVNLHTTNSFVWVAEGNDDFLGPLLLGNRAPDVLNEGAEPALGSAHLTADFTLAEPGAPLPDLLQVAFAPEPGMELRRITFQAQASGVLHAAYGVAEGTPGRMVVNEVGLFNTSGRGRGVADGFPVELIDLAVIGSNPHH